MVGSGNHDGVDVLVVERAVVVVRGLRGVSALGFDAIGGLGGVFVVDIDDGDNVDLRLIEKGVKELIPSAPSADESNPDLVVWPYGRRRLSGEERRGPSDNAHKIPS